MPQITVIVPVYKVEAYLHRCLDSFLNQTFTDFDLVLINDGSPDLCGVICNEYALRDDRIHVIHHKENLGLSAARNSGIDWAFENSDSQWICFVDSDDWVSNKYLESLHTIIKGFDIAVTNAYTVDCETVCPHETTDFSFSIYDTEEFFCHHIGIATVVWGKLFSKYLFTTLRFPVGRIFEDNFISYQLLFQFKKFPMTKQRFYYCFKNPESITRQNWSVERLDILDALEEQIDFFVRNNFMNIAAVQFRAFIEGSLFSIDQIRNYPFLSASAKREHIETVQCKQRRMILKYHKYNWFSIWKRGEDLWFLSSAFPPIRYIHTLWRMIKKIILKCRNYKPPSQSSL